MNDPIDDALAALERLMAPPLDLDGKPMSLREWMFEFETRDVGRGIVAQTYLPNGYWISTVWLGVDHRWLGEGPPVTFETMVFMSWGDRRSLTCRRYHDEAAAKRGHAEFEHRWRQKARRKS